MSQCMRIPAKTIIRQGRCLSYVTIPDVQISCTISHVRGCAEHVLTPTNALVKCQDVPYMVVRWLGVI